jgi:hypothetical protein
MANLILRQTGEIQRSELLSRNLPLPAGVLLEEYSVDTNIFVRDSNLNEFIPEYIKNNYKEGSEILQSNGSNKFTAENPYDFNRNTTSKVFDVINGIADIFKGNSLIPNIGTGDFQTSTKLQNSVLGRVLTLPNETELGRIGLRQLAVLFANRTSEQYLSGLIPTIDIRNEEGRISLKPNNWSISAPYVSDVRGFRFYYIGDPTNEPNQRYRDHSLPPGTAGGMINTNSPNDFIEDDGFGSLVYTNTNLILSDNSNYSSTEESQKFLGSSLQWEKQQSQRENIFSNAFKGSNPYKRGLLRLTQQIINDGNADNTSPYHPGKIITMPFRSGDEAIDPSKDALPRGNRVGVTIKASLDKKKKVEGTYCRNWTKNRRYDNVNSLVRGTNSRNINGSFFNNTASSNSVLQDNGFVRVGYTKNADTIDAKNFMLSIENLAWDGLQDELPELEKGDNGGRLMWFPPYDLQFSEQNQANWDSTQFLGRVEPIYTYNNSERTGTLSFKVISDYPAILDSEEFQNLDYEEFQKFFFGCLPINTIPKPKDSQEDIKVKNSQTLPQIQIPSLDAYFANDVTVIQSGYIGWDITYLDNDGFTKFEEKLISIINQIKSFNDDYKIKIEINGQASSRCIPGPNTDYDCTKYNGTTLPNARRKTLKNYIKEKFSANDVTENIYELVDKSPASPGGQGNSINSDIEIFSRNAKATFTISDFANGSRDTTTYIIKNGKRETIEIDDRNEYVFKKMTDKFVFDDEVEFQTLKDDKFLNAMFRENLKEKLKHFHPGFHSTTPQGLNRRLTFLIQCTRPGLPIDVKDINDRSGVRNSAFGKPPVCVLRLGDFYHTKIIIDNVNIDYETTWDLNPEGIGVQPMIATVSINFKFLGGSSMAGPISRLQNALQHNFFANTEMYQKFNDTSSWSDNSAIENRTLNPFIVRSSRPILTDKITGTKSTITTFGNSKGMDSLIVIPSTNSTSISSDPPTLGRPSAKELDDIETKLIESKTGSKVQQGSGAKPDLGRGFFPTGDPRNLPDEDDDD